MREKLGTVRGGGYGLPFLSYPTPTPLHFLEKWDGFLPLRGKFPLFGVGQKSLVTHEGSWRRSEN